MTMSVGVTSRLGKLIARWLTKDPEHPSDSVLLLNYDRLSYEIRPGDVILLEGRSKVSEVIKMITQNPWTHAALYIGRLYEIEDVKIREHISRFIDTEPEQQLIIETLLGEGTVVYPLHKYRNEHLRICRPNGLSPRDAQKVIGYVVNRLGTNYDVRQLMDLARFMFPYGIIPRRWRSSLFNHNAGDPTRTVCSTMLAQAFQSVRFPLLPMAEHTEDHKVHFYQRNPRLVTPRDFDYSPYFDIIKYPLFGLDDVAVYRHLPWGDMDIVCNDIDDCFRELPKHVLLDEITDTTPAATTQRKNLLNLLRRSKPVQGEVS
jgi:hypothetical protein